MPPQENPINRALAIYDQGQKYAAIAALRCHLAAQPNDQEAHINLGVLLRQEGRFEEAVTAYKHFLERLPNHVNTWIDLGLAYRHLKRHEDARAAYLQALALQPHSLNALNNLANLCLVTRDYAEAKRLYDQSIAFLSPHIPHQPGQEFLFVEGHYQLPDGQRCNHVTLVTALFQKALTLLTLGEYEEGWKLYEYRWQHPLIQSNRRYQELPQWRGEAIPHKTLLLFAEQGLGDTLQLLRLLPLVREKLPQTKLILLLPNALLPLLENQALAREVQLAPLNTKVSRASNPSTQAAPATVSEEGTQDQPEAEQALEADCASSLLSLPYTLRLTTDTIPRHFPYLQAPASSTLTDLGPRLAGEVRIGLTCSGKQAPDKVGDYLANRAIPLKTLQPLFDWCPNHKVRFYLLQTELLPEDHDHLLTCRGQVVDLRPLIRNMADTAALITQMDMVFSNDTSVAHLALALGAPTALLLWFGADWRWEPTAGRSWWYPDAHLLRQEQLGDWQAVVAAALALLENRFPSRTKTLAPSPPASDNPVVTQARTLQKQGDWNGARKLLLPYLQTLPRGSEDANAETSLCLSQAHHPLGEGDAVEGIARLHSLRRRFPTWRDVAFNTAVCEELLANYQSAHHSYRDLMERFPDDLETYNAAFNLCCKQWKNLALTEEVMRDELLFYARQYLLRAPQDPLGHQLMARALTQALNTQDAITYYETTHYLAPSAASACDLVQACKDDLQWQRAEQLLADFITQYPKTATLLNCSGLLHLLQRRYDQAQAAFEKAIANADDNSDHLAQYRYNLSFCLLQRGDYAQGFKHYEVRPQNQKQKSLRPDLHGTPWHGGELKHPLLLFCEQGLGDMLQFLRFVKPLAERYPEIAIALETYPWLKNLFANQDWLRALNVQVVAPGDVLPEMTFAQCPLLSLPAILQSDMAINPFSGPYISVTVAEKIAARQTLETAAPQAQKRLGLCWRGTQQHPLKRWRSLPLETLLPLLTQHSNHQWVVLQPLGDNATDRAEKQLLQQTLPLAYFPPLKDFHDTARYVAAVDGVITIDTALAHLAGAMACPTLLLLMAAPDWRWELAPDHSPWYPSITPLRQEKIKDWSGVMQRLQDLLS